MVDAARSGFESGAARAGSGDEYRTIPKNLTEIIKKELTNDDEDIGMIEKMIFTLKDPLSAIKISLPVKASICMHFECFDFETFCIFNKIPEGIKYVTRKDLVKKNYEMKKYDKERNELREKLRQQPRNSRSINLQLQKLQRNLTIPAYTAKFNPYSFPSPKVPSYKCPICDRLFALHQLYISDAYNFFVKTTPLDINRVELVDMIKYRILDDRPASMIPLGKNGGGEEEEIIVLSDEEDDEFDSDSNRNGNRNGNGNGNGIHGNGSGTGTGTGTVKESNRHTPNKLYNRDNSEDIFDDGLDQELLSLGTKGIGSWDDPVTLD